MRIKMKRSSDFIKYIFSRFLKQKIIMIHYCESVDDPGGYWDITLSNGTQWRLENLKQYPEVMKK